MPVTYTVPEATAVLPKLLADTLKKYHPDLDALGVRIGILLASSDNGAAVKSSGYPALAKIKVMPLKERVTKGYDAELVIDEREWADLGPKERVALLDHEAEHLRPVTKTVKATGQVIQLFDGIGRPRLKTVKADFDVGDCHLSVVARHGESAIEFFNIRRAHAKATAALNGEVG